MLPGFMRISTGKKVIYGMQITGTEGPEKKDHPSRWMKKRKILPGIYYDHVFNKPGESVGVSGEFGQIKGVGKKQ